MRGGVSVCAESQSHINFEMCVCVNSNVRKQGFTLNANPLINTSQTPVVNEDNTEESKDLREVLKQGIISCLFIIFFHECS